MICTHTTLTSHSEEETRKIARMLIKDLSLPAVLALHGDLGSGKTAFVQGLADALGITEPVTSPTFTLVNEYCGKTHLYHIDVYRLAKPEDALFIGIEDYFLKKGLVAIEWAERAGDLVPENALHVTFKALPASDHRRITISRGETGQTNPSSQSSGGLN